MATTRVRTSTLPIIPENGLPPPAPGELPHLAASGRSLRKGRLHGPSRANAREQTRIARSTQLRPNRSTYRASDCKPPTPALFLAKSIALRIAIRLKQPQRVRRLCRPWMVFRRSSWVGVLRQATSSSLFTKTLANRRLIIFAVCITRSFVLLFFKPIR